LAYQAEDQYVIEVQSRRQQRAAVAERPTYTGERMSATFQDIDSRTLLQQIAETSGRNIIVSDSVGGSVTLRLNNVPWDQVLDIVLRTKGLDKRIHENVILVGPTEELSAREKAELAARQEVQELAPLRTEVVQVNFAKAQDIATLIRSQSTGAGGAAGGSLLSARGNISVYPGINALLIQDTPDSITAIRDLVSQLDIPVRQVQIEARIVAVSEDFSRNLGVRFGVTGLESNGSNG